MSTIIEQLTIRLYHGDDRDEAIAKHLADFDSQPQGAKHNAVKQLLYFGLQVKFQEEENTSAVELGALRKAVREAVETFSPDLDRQVILQAVREAVRETGRSEGASGGIDFTLADIRKVVEVALEEKLGRCQAAFPGSESPTEREAERDRSEQEKIDAALDRLGASASQSGLGGA